MTLVSFLGSLTTVLSFVVFVGIVIWAYSKRRREQFDAAALAPFALPDDAPQSAAAPEQRP